MKKTFTVNISGIVFHIDEDAYEKLGIYLASVKAHLRDEDGTEEILSDIENRIAEMFQQKLNLSKTVIILSDVEDVIAQLGEPEQFEDDHEDDRKKKNYSNKTYQERGSRRLYRDTDDKFIAGVAGGIAAFFGIDPTWIRAAFIIFTFFYGFGPLLYIIMWIIVPRARTTAERLEMRGERVNLSNIEKSIREELNEIKENIKEFSEGKKANTDKNDPKNKTKIRQQGLANAFTIAAGVILLVLAFGFLLAVLSSIFLIPVVFSFSSVVWDINLPQLISALLPSPFFANLAIAGLLLVFLIPIFWMIMAGIQLLFKLKVEGKALGIITLILWLSGIAMVSLASVNGVRNFATSYDYSEEFILSESQWPNLYLQLDRAHSHRVFLDDMDDRVSNFMAFAQGSGNTAAGIPNLSIRKTDADVASVRITREARGPGRNAAMSNARNLDFSFSQIDSLVLLEPVFTYNRRVGWRDQQLSIELFVPANKTVVIPEDFDKTIPWSRDRRVRVLEDR